MSNRTNAMAWWNHDLHWTEKDKLMVGKLQDRYPQSLTESEIEKLWKNQ